MKKAATMVKAELNTGQLATEILIVDLDETLLKTDLMVELLRVSLASNYIVFFKFLWLFFSDRARAKAYLADKVNIDISQLPYNTEILQLIQAVKSDGGKVGIATGSNRKYAQQISDYFELNLPPVASTEVENLVGEAKADELVRIHGPNIIMYAGNSPSDLPVWNISKKIIIVTNRMNLKNKVSKLGKPVTYIHCALNSLTNFFQLIRPHQMLKNILVFVPLLAAHNLNPERVLETLLAFFCFCLCAASIYIINDIVDLEHDRAHRWKCTRPLASGDFSLLLSIFVTITLAVLAVISSLFLPLEFTITLLFYLVLTTCYSVLFKNLIILDLINLTSFYSLRILGGSLATQIPISQWLMSFSLVLFLSLATVKRIADLKIMKNVNKTNYSGPYKGSDIYFLNNLASSAGMVSLVIFALYLNSAEASILYGNTDMLWGVCLVLMYWIFRLIILANRGLIEGDPISFAITDNISLFCAMLCLSFVLLGVS